MKTLAEYINSECSSALEAQQDEFAQFNELPRKGKAVISKDLYWYKSVDPKATFKGLITVSSNPADAQKAADKELNALKKKKAFKDRLEIFDVQKYPKGTYDYSSYVSSLFPGENRLESITLPLGRSDYFTLDRWNVLKLFKEGVLKFK